MGGLYLEGEEVTGVELEDSSSLTLKNYVLEFIKEQDDQREENVVQEPHSSLEEEKSLSGSTRIFSDSDLIYSLYIYIDGEISDHISLNEGQNWIIGRSEECDISIDYSILTRRHLQISKIAGSFYIKDLGSSNKTFLNNKELEPQKEALLKANDEISVSDLKMVFEVRNKNFEQMMSNLPALVSEDSDEVENLPAIAFSKVVLEETPQDDDAASKKPGFLNMKKMIILALLVVLGFGLYFKYESNKKEKQRLAQQQKDKEFKDKLNVFYNEAFENYENQRFRPCIGQVEELQKFAAGTDYPNLQNVQKLLVDCQNALEKQIQKEEYLAREKAKKETEEKIKKIVDECKKQFSENIIQTEDDLNRCAEELLRELDPENSEISAMRMEILEREQLKALENEKKEAYRALIARKKALYNKAKNVHNRSKLSEAPEVVRAYDVFLKSARNFSPLQELYKQAEFDRHDIQKKYDRELARLYESCHTLISRKKLKEAYYDCKKILEFKKDDKKAKEYMNRAKLNLQREFKSIYEQSMLDESFSRIEEAKKLWNEILEKDVKEGYYYKKALSQIKKYK